jgi:hypothetical protein
MAEAPDDLNPVLGVPQPLKQGRMSMLKHSSLLTIADPGSIRAEIKTVVEVLEHNSSHVLLSSKDAEKDRLIGGS